MISKPFRWILLGCLACFAAAVAGAQSDKKLDDGGKSPARAAGRGDAKAPAAAKTPAPRIMPEKEAEMAITESARSFTAAYNRHDAAAIAAAFTASGEFVAEDGSVLQGREAIRRHFAGVFAAVPLSRISLTVESVRVIAPNAAIEEGVTESSVGPNEPPEHSRYAAVHVKQNGQWLVAIARDFSAGSDFHENHHELQQLEFLIGEWIGEGEGVLTRNSCRWVDDRNFLLEEFTIQMEGRGTISGSVRIGWDPQARQIRSWTFDSRGGSSEARWTRAGNSWFLKSEGTTREGRSSSATTLLSKVDESTLSWESHDRVEGGVPDRDTPKVILKRRPPLPGE